MKDIRQEWRDAWRLARIIENSKPSNPTALASLKGLQWIALLRLGRRNTPDSILSTPEVNREVNRIVDRVIGVSK